MTDLKVDAYARNIWNYMSMHEQPTKSDAIFCLCSHDVRVAERAADLMNQDYGKLLIISGGAGKLTKDLFDEPEAVVFSKIAVERGVNPNLIIIEPKSTNTGENVRFTHELLREKNIDLKSFVLVQKPYMERRTYATFKKQWPDPETHIIVTSPLLTYDRYTANGIPKNEVINIMVGDLQRIREYPKLGYQIDQEIPNDVWDAYNKLISAGYTEHLIR